jgi:lysophospholipase L1-like esterase
MRGVVRRFLAVLAACSFVVAGCSSNGSTDAGVDEPSENQDGDGQVDDGADEQQADPGPGDQSGDPGLGDAAGDQDPADPGPGDPAGDQGAADQAADSGADQGPTDFPIDQLDDLKLYINIGDSLAAGYDASGENSSGGKGYARLMLENHPDYAAYSSHNLKAIYPSVEFVDVSDSGDTSAEALDNLNNALIWLLPQSLDGDVLVSLTCGGNDFNDDIWTMLLRTRTEQAANDLESNYTEMVDKLRQRYDKPAQGHQIVFLITNVHDPTAGTGSIPPGYSDGFCEMLNNPLFTPSARQTAIENMEFFNQRMAEVIENLAGHLVDNHAVFFEHGMNAEGSLRWITDDCIHPSNEGHHQLRREEWFTLSGERY